MTNTLALTEISDTLDTLADVMVSDRMDELARYDASFWRDAAWGLCSQPINYQRRQVHQILANSQKSKAGRQASWVPIT